MNNNQNVNCVQSSIEDITTQCESLSLSSSETDNITVDSGIFFENKSYYKKFNSSCDGGSLYRMLNSDSIPPPPPPYNSTHNIISKSIQTPEEGHSFQTATSVNSIPYYNDSICSNRYSTSMTKQNLDSAYLTENSTSRNCIISSIKPNSLSQRFLNVNDIPMMSNTKIHHSHDSDNSNTDPTVLPNLPQVPSRQRTNDKGLKPGTHMAYSDVHTPLPSRQIIEPGKNFFTNEPVADDEILGICNKCQYTVTNSESACIALGQFYHSSCFICSYCNRSLRGKVFYKDRDNVYCESDYLRFGFQKSTKRCNLCGHIITESILEALGKAFHPQCFKCSVCDKCLDGIPFTVDQNNNIYCIPDYHLTFAPRCAICCQSITPCNDSDDVVRVVVNDRDFHVDCYRCQNCCRPLTNDSNCFVWSTNQSSVNVKLLCRRCYVDKFRQLSRHQHQ